MLNKLYYKDDYMSKNQKKIGIILNYIAQIIQIITGLAYTPIMIRLLGQNEYGLYQLVFSVTSYLSLLSFGFSSSYVRFYSRIIARESERSDIEISKLNGMYMTIFLLVSIISCICGFFMIKNITLIFGESLSTQEYNMARVLMGFMVLNITLTFPNSLFDSITSAHESFFFQKLLIVVQSLLNPFLTLPLLIMGYGSKGMVMITTFLTLGKLIINGWYCIKKLKVKFVFKDFNYFLLKEIWIFTSFIFINIIVDQINWNVDKYLLGRFIGTAAVAVYGIGSQLNAIYLQVSLSVSNVFIPQVNNLVVNSKDNRKLTILFTKIGRIQFLIIVPILLGFIFFGKFFIMLWAGKDYTSTYYVALLLMLPVTIPLIQNIGIEIQRAKNKHQARSIAYVVIAFTNILISIPMIQKWGVVGAALGTAITMFLGNGVFMNIYYHKAINFDMIYFWTEIKKLMPVFYIPTMIGIIYVLLNNSTSILYYFIFGFIFVISYLFSLWIFGLKEEEKLQIKTKFSRF